MMKRRSWRCSQLMLLVELRHAARTRDVMIATLVAAERRRLRTIVSMQRATATPFGRKRSVALRATEGPAPGRQPDRGSPEPWPVAALERPDRQGASPR